VFDRFDRLAGLLWLLSRSSGGPFFCTELRERLSLNPVSMQPWYRCSPSVWFDVPCPPVGGSLKLSLSSVVALAGVLRGESAIFQRELLPFTFSFGIESTLPKEDSSRRPSLNRFSPNPGFPLVLVEFPR